MEDCHHSLTRLQTLLRQGHFGMYQVADDIMRTAQENLDIESLASASMDDLYTFGHILLLRELHMSNVTVMGEGRALPSPA